MHLRLPVLSVLLLLAVAVPSAFAVVLPGFRSPTGNIRCFVLVGHSGDLLCSIGRADYAQALQSRCIDGGAGVDWHGFTLGVRGKEALNCSGGIQYDPAKDRPSTPVLNYGHAWHRGGFACASSRTGVTCRNGSGHGLFISRGAWRAR